jgi:hypothetical protein
MNLDDTDPEVREGMALAKRITTMIRTSGDRRDAPMHNDVAAMPMRDTFNDNVQMRDAPDVTDAPPWVRPELDRRAWVFNPALTPPMPGQVARGKKARNVRKREKRALK